MTAYIIATGQTQDGRTFSRLCTSEAYRAFERNYPYASLASVWDGPPRAHTSDAIDDAYEHAERMGWEATR